LEQCLDLFDKNSRRLARCDGADWRQWLADAADRAGQEDGLAADLFRLSGDLDAAEVDVSDLAFEPESGQLDSIGRKGVGLDDLRAGPDVSLVYLLHQIWLQQVELIE